jgi:hypothetical protein
MTANYTPVYNGNGIINLVITLEAMRLAIESVPLIKQFKSAIYANASQGYRLLEDPNYFISIRGFITSVEDAGLLEPKIKWGAKILSDDGYTERMAKLAILQSVSGIAKIENNEQVIEALIPAVVENGELQPIDNNIIVEAVARLSNDNTIIKILVKNGEL